VIENGNLSDENRLKTIQYLHEQFKIDHVTLQIEQGDQNHPCPQGETC